MRTIALFDTEIATTNIGDKIIQDCILEAMEDILNTGFYLKLATHVRNFGPLQMAIMSRGRKLGFFRDADWKFICGTNLITQKRVRFDIRPPQWQLFPSNLSLYEGSILVGVGTTDSDDQPDFYARWLYRKALDHDFIHSVRDDLTKRYIENLGLKAINTGCPTLWKFTPEFCREIPTKKAPACIFSVSGYKTQRDVEQDKKLIEILERNYEKLYAWIQTPIDETYLNELVGEERFERIVSLPAYHKKLQEGNIDYVGTRLHGGVYALQHKCRSIIISIDHRAEGFHATNNLPIVRRADIETELEQRIQSEFETKIVIDQEAIDTFLDQFRNCKIERKKSVPLRRRIKAKIVAMRHVASVCVKNVKGIGYAFIRNTFPVDPNKVMVFTFQNGYACNPKYIHQELEKNVPEMKVSWVVDNVDLRNDLPKGVKVIKRGTKEYYRELYTSKIWIDNALNVQKLPVKRKKNQFYIQTMHGSLGIKRIGTNAKNDPKQKQREKKSVELTNVAISNSTFETEVYRTSFWRDAEAIGADAAALVKKNPEKCYIMELGHARSDILIRSGSDEEVYRQIREKVCRYFDLDPSKKIILWGPTFEASTQTFCEPDFEGFCHALKERFGGDWAVINRLHPRDERRKKHHKRKSSVHTDVRIIDGGQYMDIQELMIAADFAVTNYSSWIFDYVLTRKPGMLFTSDLKNYEDTTGFYYPIKSTPFPVVVDNDEAMKAIREFDLDKYQRDIAQFVVDRGCMEDGYAAQRIVELIKVLSN